MCTADVYVLITPHKRKQDAGAHNIESELVNIYDKFTN